MMEDYEILKQMLAALAVGLLIGTERGWSGRKEGEGERIAGLRTFSLIALLGGVWAQLSVQFGGWVMGSAFAVIAVLIIVGHYFEVKRNGDMGTTTAFSMMLTFSLAAWAASGHYLLALATSVVVVTLLSLKPVLHRWVRNIETAEVYAGVKLLIISVIFLPLLPDEGYGPFDAFNPYWIWWMVVLICGISFVGYFAIKHIGNRLGTLVTSITGGLASSTAVTLSLSEFAAAHREKALFMGGVMIASSIMFVRVLVEVSVVNASLLDLIWLPITVMFFSVLACGYWLWRKNREATLDTELNLDNPFQIGMAIKFGVLLAIILILTEAMKSWYGDQGVYVLSVVSGLMDVDAITLSLSRSAIKDLNAEVASIGIILASATNTVVKGFIFAFIAGIRESAHYIGLLVLSVIPGLITAYLMILL